MNVFIFGAISTETVNKTIQDIVENSDPAIYVYINSEGGLEEGGYAIYEALRLSGKKIITHAVQEVCSAAVIVYLAGDERYSTNYAKFMIHEIYHELEKEATATSKTYQASREELRKATETYFNLICARTEIAKQRIKNAISKAPDGDWWFNAANAKKMGVVHKIGFPLPMAKNKPLPAAKHP